MGTMLKEIETKRTSPQSDDLHIGMGDPEVGAHNRVELPNIGKQLPILPRRRHVGF